LNFSAGATRAGQYSRRDNHIVLNTTTKSNYQHYFPEFKSACENVV